MNVNLSHIDFINNNLGLNVKLVKRSILLDTVKVIGSSTSSIFVLNNVDAKIRNYYSINSGQISMKGRNRNSTILIENSFIESIHLNFYYISPYSIIVRNNSIMSSTYVYVNRGTTLKIKDNTFYGLLYLRSNSWNSTIMNCTFNSATMRLHGRFTIRTTYFTGRAQLNFNNIDVMPTLVEDCIFRDIQSSNLLSFYNGDVNLNRNVFSNCSINSAFIVHRGARIVMRRNVFRAPFSASLLFKVYPDDYSDMLIDARRNYFVLNYTDQRTKRYRGCEDFFVDSRLGRVLLNPALATDDPDTNQYVYDVTEGIEVHGGVGATILVNGGVVYNDTELLVLNETFVTKSIFIPVNVTLQIHIDNILNFAIYIGIKVYGWYA